MDTVLIFFFSLAKFGYQFQIKEQGSKLVLRLLSKSTLLVDCKGQGMFQHTDLCRNAHHLLYSSHVDQVCVGELPVLQIYV